VFFQEQAGIHVLPAGTVPPNPLELLSSRRFEEVIAKIKDAFDIVVIDSPPLQLVSDALVLAQHSSSVIYVVKADATPYQVAQNGIKRLRRVGAPLLGVVLNQLDLERAEKYYGEYSGYRSYKGYKKHGYTKTYGYEMNARSRPAVLPFVALPLRSRRRQRSARSDSVVGRRRVRWNVDRRRHPPADPGVGGTRSRARSAQPYQPTHGPLESRRTDRRIRNRGFENHRDAAHFPPILGEPRGRYRLGTADWVALQPRLGLGPSGRGQRCGCRGSRSGTKSPGGGDRMVGGRAALGMAVRRGVVGST
jgi:hypothetical protein